MTITKKDKDLVCALFKNQIWIRSEERTGRLLSTRCTNNKVANPIIGCIEHMEAVLKAAWILCKIDIGRGVHMKTRQANNT